VSRPRRQLRLAPGRWFGLLGTLTIVLVAVIGFVAYRANLGLPWQSRYEVYADVADADRLITAADVRIGGVLAGEVLQVTAERSGPGRPAYARLKLALNPPIRRLPVDSTVQVRPASVLGLTYVDLRPGGSRRSVPAGGTLPLSRSLPSSDVTDLFGVFDSSSARSFQTATAGLADGLAGRGGSVNQAIASSSRLLPAATRVAEVLAATGTRFGPFLHAYEAAIQALAPVGAGLGQAIADGATTLGAIAGVRPALGEAIDLAPAAEAATTTAFIAARPALDGLARLARALRPAGALLPGSLAQIDATLASGVAPLRMLPGFSRPLRTALRSLRAMALDPNTSNALRKLPALIAPTNQVLATFVPAQVNCDVLGLWGVGFSSTFAGQGDGLGPALPNLVITGAGAQGEALQSARPAANLNTNPLPQETQGRCESGNERFTGHQQLNNQPNFSSLANRTTTPPPGVAALARRAGLLTAIAGIR
jgi:ABC-type transporter Mla subunit MlaD